MLLRVYFALIGLIALLCFYNVTSQPLQTLRQYHGEMTRPTEFSLSSPPQSTHPLPHNPKHCTQLKLPSLRSSMACQLVCVHRKHALQTPWKKNVMFCFRSAVDLRITLFLIPGFLLLYVCPLGYVWVDEIWVCFLCSLRTGVSGCLVRRRLDWVITFFSVLSFVLFFGGVFRRARLRVGLNLREAWWIGNCF